MTNKPGDVCVINIDKYTIHLFIANVLSSMYELTSTTKVLLGCTIDLPDTRLASSSVQSRAIAMLAGRKVSAISAADTPSG